MDDNEPSRAAKAVMGYYDRQRERGALPPQTPGNGLAHPDWDYNNRNVIKAKPQDESELFDEDGFYIGSGDFY